MGPSTVWLLKLSTKLVKRAMNVSIIVSIPQTVKEMFEKITIDLEIQTALCDGHIY